MQLRSKLQSLDSRKEKNEKNNCRFFSGITSTHSVAKSHKRSHFTKLPDAQISTSEAKIQIFPEFPEFPDN